jgi:hypothetical protein
MLLNMQVHFSFLTNHHLNEIIVYYRMLRKLKKLCMISQSVVCGAGPPRNLRSDGFISSFRDRLIVQMYRFFPNKTMKIGQFDLSRQCYAIETV